MDRGDAIFLTMKGKNIEIKPPYPLVNYANFYFAIKSKLPNNMKLRTN